MAITTINEKLSLISFRQPCVISIPISSDGLDQANLQHLLHEYSGLLWSTLSVSFEEIIVNSAITKEVRTLSNITKEIIVNSAITKEVKFVSKIY